MGEKFNFNISLSVLNHLGRNLYRNIITVLGEAISNSWDADAQNVWIQIDRERNTMCILDDGTGMSPTDFQDKFLKIGYSKRKNNNYKSKLGRPFIGRKGIGKLALLSCAKRIHIASKTENTNLIGGIIDNSGLDEAIRDDLSSQEYLLGELEQDFSADIAPLRHGTLILFESVTNGVFNTIDYIKKSIALYFRFSLIDENFNIYVNDEKITDDLLSDFSKKSQFLWRINGFNDSFISTMENLEKITEVESRLNVKGYIASVKKPSNLKIRGTQEKVTIDLFVNGRLREKDILRHIPTTRIVESYVYGQIHFDELDSGGNKDVFTSSREGIVSDDPLYERLLKEIDKLFREIIDQWDELRRSSGDDGDPDNLRITPKARKAQELFNTTLRDYETDEKFKKGGLVEAWAKMLSEEAQFNIPSYTECFISENLLRQYVQYTKMTMSPEAITEAQNWKRKEQGNKDKANISYDVRRSDQDLFYLDMTALACLVDKVPSDKPPTAGLSRSAIVYKPMRDAVGHTSLLTPVAKQQLTIEYENIKARLEKILQEMDKKDKE